MFISIAIRISISISISTHQYHDTISKHHNYN